MTTAVPYSALQSRGGDGFFTYDPSVGEGERTVFPCTKSAVEVGGVGPLWGDSSAAAKCRGVGVNKGIAIYFADGIFTRGRPDEPSSTVRDV